MAKGRIWGATRNRVLRILNDKPSNSTELHAILGITQQAVSRMLLSMMKQGIVRRVQYRCREKGRGRPFRFRWHALVSSDDVLSTGCPRCGSGPGSRCWAGSALTEWPHAERFYAAVARASNSKGAA